MLTRQTSYILHDKNGVAYILDTQLIYLKRCMSFMHQAIFGRNTYFKEKSNFLGKLPRQHTSILSKHFRFLAKYPRIWSSQYHFHPALTLFFEEYRRHPISSYCNYNPQDRTGDGRLIADIFDDFVCTIRAQASALGLRKKIADWESKANKNRARMLEVEKQIFSSSRRVAVVRLDLEYQASYFSVEEINKYVEEADWELANPHESYWSVTDLSTSKPLTGRVTFEEVQADRKRLFGNMKCKPSLFRHQIGYIWKIDAIPKAGYRLCVALFFDAALCEKQYWLSRYIGEYWSSDITQTRGCYIIPSYRNSDRFDLSSINGNDYEARSNLREMVLSELCAKDQFVQVLSYPSANMFGSKFTAGSPQKRRHDSKGFEIV